MGFSLERSESLSASATRVYQSRRRCNPDPGQQRSKQRQSIVHHGLPTTQNGEDRKVWLKVGATQTRPQSDEYSTVRIESKIYTLEYSRNKLLQLCEERGRRGYRFWINRYVHQWICKCLETAIHSSGTWTQQLKDGNRLFYFSVRCNSNGFFARIDEKRFSSSVWIVIPEGKNKLGFRIFLSELRKFAENFRKDTLGSLECLCYLQSLGNASERLDSNSPSLLFFESDLEREGLKVHIDRLEMTAQARSKLQCDWNSLPPVTPCPFCALTLPACRSGSQNTATLARVNLSRFQEVTDFYNEHAVNGNLYLNSATAEQTNTSSREGLKAAASEAGSWWKPRTSGEVILKPSNLIPKQLIQKEVIFEVDGNLFVRTVSNEVEPERGKEREKPASQEVTHEAGQRASKPSVGQRANAEDSSSGQQSLEEGRALKGMSALKSKQNQDPVSYPKEAAQALHSRTTYVAGEAQTKGGSYSSRLIGTETNMRRPQGQPTVEHIRPLEKTTSKLDSLLSAYLGSLSAPMMEDVAGKNVISAGESAGPPQQPTASVAIETGSMLGSQNRTEGQMPNISGADVGAATMLRDTHIDTPGNGNGDGHLVSASVCSGIKPKVKQADGRIDGFNALKRMATSGLKNVINAGRTAAVSYLKIKDHERSDQGKSIESFNDVPFAIGSHHIEPNPMRVNSSKLNINAPPFEPMYIPLEEGNIKAPPDPDLEESLLLIFEEPRNSDKGNKVCVVEIDVCDEEDRVIHDKVLEEPEDFKIGKGGKANKGKKSKSKKKRR